MTLHEGRPPVEGLSEAELACFDFLDKLGVPYFTVAHGPCADMEACRAVDGALGASVCKNLFLWLSFADEGHMREFLNLSPGSVSVLGLLFDREKRVRLVIDEEVLAAEWVGCHPCKNTASLKLKTADLLQKVLPALGHAPTVVRLTGEG